MLKLWLTSAQTVSAVAPAPADDELFLKQAESILRGEWLGALDPYTLAKGPIYSLWIAAVSLTGVPLLVAQQALFLAAVALVAIAVRPVLRPRWARAALFCLVAFQPGSFADGPATRVIRDGFYSSLTLLLLASVTGLALRLADSPRRASAWALAAGLFGALVAMTREEGIWVLPSIVATLGAGVAIGWRTRGRAWLLPAALGLCAFLVPIATVASVNASRYGVFTTCEVTSEYFKSAYGALTRVRGERWRPYVPVPLEARRAIFRASPAFREIAPYLEEGASGWAAPGCKLVGVCDDIAGGWFMWAFRDAVGAAGHYRRGGDSARGWYLRLAGEIDDACQSGQLSCDPPSRSLAPRWNAAYARPFFSSLLRGLAGLLTMTGVTSTPTAAYASEPDLRRYERITNARIPRTTVHVAGVVTSRGPMPRAAVTDSAMRPHAATIEARSLGPDPTDPGAQRARFDVETTCSSACEVWLVRGDEPLLNVPIGPEAAPLSEATATWRTVEYARDPAPPGPLAQLRFRVLDAVARAWGWVTPVLLPLAVALGAMRVFRAIRTRRAADVLVPAIALALLGGALARVVLLAAVEATAFPAINVLYAAPAYALVTAATALLLLAEVASRLGAPPTSPRPEPCP